MTSELITNFENFFSTFYSGYMYPLASFIFSYWICTIPVAVYVLDRIYKLFRKIR